MSWLSGQGGLISVLAARRLPVNGGAASSALRLLVDPLPQVA